MSIFCLLGPGSGVLISLEKKSSAAAGGLFYTFVTNLTVIIPIYEWLLVHS
jgi:hypothetical protein